MFWDGRSKNVETQAKQPFLNLKEMGMPNAAAVVTAVKQLPEYNNYFTAAFPNEYQPITFSNIANALGAFERKLMTPNSKFDQFIRGNKNALSDEQLIGLEVFLREGCASCHNGPLLGGQDMHLNEDYPNTPDGDNFEFRKKLGNTYKVKISPLQNITKTAPYLHDGRYPTLEASLNSRLDAYMIREVGIHDTVELHHNELKAMIAFFASLTGTINQDYIKIPK